MPGIDPAFAQALRDRYLIERELGRGGMATVYLARDLRHDRPVALKLLHPELASTLGPERFQREIRLAAGLQHPHILSVHDSGESAGRLWFTMPYVEGESLRERLSREGQLPLDDALRIAREVADALDYAHRHGVVHRDVKPENILITESHALLADFGISRTLETSGERLTETGFAVGTPAYMSPEQATGETVTARTDVYSLGVVLYEMLAGEPPFTGPTAQAIIAKRLSGEAPGIRRIRPSVPPSVERAALKAMAPLSADRFATAAEFARALTMPASPAETEARPTTLKAERRPWSSSAMGIGLGFLLGVGVLFAWLGTRSPGDHGRPTRLAVLPFESLGAPDQEYFADGITDAVRGKLTSVPGLQVIARRSSSQYRRTDKTPKEIGRELGVEYLLTGTVRWEKGAAGGPSRVQVSPELIEVDGATAEWQQPFDAPLTDVFQVQADIAGRVAEALGVALGASERKSLAERPTANLAAYDAYLKGEEVAIGLSTADPITVRQAADYYQQAVTLDSTFAQAWVQLSRANSLLYFRGIRSSSTADIALQAAQRALALAPQRAESYLAMGDYYANVPLTFPEALAQYAKGRRIAPADPDLLAAIAIAEQRSGRWDEALEHLDLARTLDPRSPFIARRYAFILLWLRRYQDAAAAYERTFALDSTNPASFQQRAMLWIMQGDSARARAVLRAATGKVDPATLVSYVAAYWDLVWLLNKDQQELLLQLTPAPFGNDPGSWGLALAQAYALKGNQVRARAYADSALPSFNAELRERPDDQGVQMNVAMALAYTGRADEAAQVGERAVASRPISKDAYTGAYYQHMLVRIYLMAGEQEKALDRLEELLGVPYFLSPGWLRVDPTFDPIRQHPRFQALVSHIPSSLPGPS